MVKNSDSSRRDILSLNLKDVRSVTTTKLHVSQENLASASVDQNFVRPWMISSSDQFLLSRQKIGTRLLEHCRNGFHLDDPYMHQSRFFVDYQRLHDPALKGYYNSIPVKNRLKKLDMINEKCDVICSNRDFVEYLRYLDSLRAKFIADTLKLEKVNLLSKNIRKSNENKKYKTPLDDNFAHKKYKRITDLDMYLYFKKRKKTNQQLPKNEKKEDVVAERIKRIKEEQRIRSKEKNDAEAEKSLLRRQKLSQNECQRKMEIRNKTEQKLMEAEKRKSSIQNGLKISKIFKNQEIMEERLTNDEESYYRNIELYEMEIIDEKRRKKERQKHLRKIQEKDEMSIVKIRQQFTLNRFKKEQNQDLIEKIMKVLPAKIEKYKPKTTAKNLEEISRRISVLNNRKFVGHRVRVANGVFQKMNLTVSAAEIVIQAKKIMMMDVVIIPEFEPINCVLVRQRLTKVISQILIDIKNEQLKRIQKERNRTKKISDTGIRRNTDKKKRKRIAFAETADVVQIDAENESGNRILSEENPKARMYKVKDVVKKELRQVLLFIVREEFIFLDEFESRDFDHLYDFQKCYLSKALERFYSLIKMRQKFDWYKFENASWKNKKINIEELLFLAANKMMVYKRDPDTYTRIIMDLSKYICIEINHAIKSVENVKEFGIDASNINEIFSTIDAEYDTESD